MLVKALGPRSARAVSVVAAALCLVYALIFAIGGWTYLQKMISIGIEMQDLPVPQWVPRLILPVGFGLLALRFAIVLFDVLRGRQVQLLGDEAEQALKLRDMGVEAPARPTAASTQGRA